MRKEKIIKMFETQTATVVLTAEPVKIKYSNKELGCHGGTIIVIFSGGSFQSTSLRT